MTKNREEDYNLNGKLLHSEKEQISSETSTYTGIYEDINDNTSFIVYTEVKSKDTYHKSVQKGTKVS